MSLKTLNNLLAHLHNFLLTLVKYLLVTLDYKLMLRVLQKLNDNHNH